MSKLNVKTMFTNLYTDSPMENGVIFPFGEIF